MWYLGDVWFLMRSTVIPWDMSLDDAVLKLEFLPVEGETAEGRRAPIELRVLLTGCPVFWRQIVLIIFYLFIVVSLRSWHRLLTMSSHTLAAQIRRCANATNGSSRNREDFSHPQQ